MKRTTPLRWESEKIAALVSLAGGKVVGRTRLQKLACLLELADHGFGFKFSYHHFGPFSEGVASGAREAALLEEISEEEKPNSWGGTYSIYTSTYDCDSLQINDCLAKVANEADLIELELAVTAAFLASLGEDRPWEELEGRKPEKATPSRLKNAKGLYAKLRAVEGGEQLPPI